MVVGLTLLLLLAPLIASFFQTVRIQLGSTMVIAVGARVPVAIDTLVPQGFSAKDNPPFTGPGWDFEGREYEISGPNSSRNVRVGNWMWGLWWFEGRPRRP